MESVLVKDRLIHGAGTTEAEWRACGGLQALPFENISSILASIARLVVCAPHPDDEILPCAGLLSAASTAGIPILVIAVTDGEASHGNRPEKVEILRKCRPRETSAALLRLGINANVRRQKIPDGKVSDFESQLSSQWDLLRTDAVITPWRLDGHPDHEATTRAVLMASSRIGFTVLETPIWGWHWSRPAESDLPWGRGFRFLVNARTLARKRDSIRAFESQLTSDGDRPAILTPATLARFERDYEVYFR